MSFSPIDKLTPFPTTLAPVEGEAASVVGERNRVANVEPLDGFSRDAIGRARTDTRELSGSGAPIDPHSLLALEAWPTTGPRLFGSPSLDSEAATRASNDLDQLAADVIAYLV